MIAYGSCASTGGIPSLANQFGREELLKFVYEDGPSTDNEQGTRPQPACNVNGHALTLPIFREVVRALDQVVDVDYYIPGCPPTPKLTQAAVGALLAGKLPPKGSVLAPDIALCDECPRKESKPTDLAFTEFKRPHQKLLDPEKCLLAQGVVCMGPATRGGCEAVCVKGNMPCTGCFGPTSRVKDQGAKILSSLAANAAPKEEREIQQVLAGIPDPVGTFYRYGLAKSLLRRRVPRPV
jgi:F420-non-reducing hydrogenase small subunit